MIAGKLLEKSDDETLGGKLGYNAATDKFEDLVAAGVIDPVKVGLQLQACACCCNAQSVYYAPPA